jgi:glycosyltransferase involved in cell wall biosynthesis
MKSDELKILSIHWGFSLGGVGKYALLIDGVCRYGPIEINSLCILCREWQCDVECLDRLNPHRVFIRSRADFSWIRQVMAAIRGYSPDLIMTHGFNGHFAALLTRLITRHPIPLVCSYHGLYHATTRKRQMVESLINRFTEFYIRTFAEAAVSVSDYSRRYLLAKKIPPEKITVIHNGIEPFSEARSSRHDLRLQWGVADDEILLGAASRLDPVKGLTYLVEALSILCGRYEKIHLVVIGTGKSEAVLRQQVAQSGLSGKVVFTGFRSDISDCLAAFDIFALPSLAEDHSIALLEAMQAGKAIVATDVGGNTESVRQGKEGIIVSPADPDGLAIAIERYIKFPELAVQMGKNAKLRFDNHFTVDVMVRKTAEWMMSCCADK